MLNRSNTHTTPVGIFRQDENNSNKKTTKDLYTDTLNSSFCHHFGSSGNWMPSLRLTRVGGGKSGSGHFRGDNISAGDGRSLPPTLVAGHERPVAGLGSRHALRLQLFPASGLLLFHHLGIRKRRHQQIKQVGLGLKQGEHSDI